jgi:hypothetical protein
MFSSKSAFIAGVFSLLLGGGQFFLAIFGKSFRFYYYFGNFWPIIAAFFCALGIGLISYPWTRKYIIAFLEKRRDKKK